MEHSDTKIEGLETPNTAEETLAVLRSALEAAEIPYRMRDEDTALILLSTEQGEVVMAINVSTGIVRFTLFTGLEAPPGREADVAVAMADTNCRTFVGAFAMYDGGAIILQSGLSYGQARFSQKFFLTEMMLLCDTYEHYGDSLRSAGAAESED